MISRQRVDEIIATVFDGPETTRALGEVSRTLGEPPGLDAAAVLAGQVAAREVQMRDERVVRRETELL